MNPIKADIDYNNLAPICLFVYNRPEHTKKTLEALAKNKYAQESTLYIYSDGPKADCSEEDIEKISLVREIVKERSWCGNVIVNLAEANQGLANSVINGVTEVIRKHGKIIVLEDDLITSNYFLKYMNDALNLYAHKENVMQISGFSYPVDKILPNNNSYFMNLTSTWGWATWERVWDKIDFECKQYDSKSHDVKKFNFNGAYNYTKLLNLQLSNKKVSSWGIRFYFNVYKKNGIVLYPDKSLVKNNGWDSSGRHGAEYELYPILDWDEEYVISVFPKDNDVNKRFLKLNYLYLKQKNSIKNKLYRKLMVMINNIIK